jgi:peptidoglycan/xylan/chitin deacetylase (PgdA/CDA1 family)
MEGSGVMTRLISSRLDGFILAFHDISPERFVGLIECLGPVRPVHLGELVQRATRHKSNTGLFAITVDDGVGATVRNLAKVLEAKGWPATFYLPTRYVETGEGMAFQWWRKLKPLLPRDVVHKHGRRMQALWHTRPPQDYLPLTMDLVQGLLASGVEKAALEPPGPITWSEVVALGKSGLIRFESHAVTHTAMSALTEEQIHFELEHSRNVITEHTGRECRHLAYPFGSDESIGAVAPLIARRYYDSATTMSFGRADGADPWRLPRIPLYEENSNSKACFKLLLNCFVLHPGAARSRAMTTAEPGGCD